MQTEQIINHFKSQNSDVADEYVVLRVATEDVQLFCSNYHGPADVVFIHLGVSGEATTVCLEECAYNNMTFRAPDEAGYQPQQESIDTHCDFDSCLKSDLPLAGISAQVAMIHEAASGSPRPVIAISSDPGRFLCNYIYYHSLQSFAMQGRLKHCVFVHVPLLDVMPLQTQIQLVSLCVSSIRDHCSRDELQAR